MLFLHCVRRAASRACCTAGSKSAIRMAIMAITTSNSINVNAFRDCGRDMRRLLNLRNGNKNGLRTVTKIRTEDARGAVRAEARAEHVNFKSRMRENASDMQSECRN